MITKRSLTLLDRVIECVFEKETGHITIKPSELWGFLFYELFVSKEQDKIWLAWDNKWCYDFDYYIIDKKSKERKTLKQDLFIDKK